MTKYDDLLANLNREVAQRLPQLSAGDARYHLATWGRTRVRKDGSVQIGRRDGQVLRQLAERSGPVEDPKQATRTVAALQNVIAANVQLMANPTGSSQNHRHARLVARDATRAAAGGVAAGAVWTGFSAMSTGSPRDVPAWDLVHRMSNAVHEIATPLGVTSPWQIGLAVGAVGVVGGVSATWIESRHNDVLDHGADNAWAKAHGPAICEGLGVADRLPELAEAFGYAKPDSATAIAEGLGAQLSAYTELDKASVLTALVQAAPAERAGAMVDILVEDSSLSELSDKTRGRAIVGVYDAIGRSQSSRRTGTSVVNAAVGAILRDAPPGQSINTLLPKADGITVDADQVKAAQAALGNMGPAGSAPGPQSGDGARGNHTGPQVAKDRERG